MWAELKDRIIGQLQRDTAIFTFYDNSKRVEQVQHQGIN